MVAPECLRKLGWLAVANIVSNLAHSHAATGEHLGGSIHPHGGQVLAESRVANLGKGPLKLAP